MEVGFDETVRDDFDLLRSNDVLHQFFQGHLLPVLESLDWRAL